MTLKCPLDIYVAETVV